jgi:tRNA(Ile)-lysidine synthase
VLLDARLLMALPEAVARRVIVYGLAAARVTAPSHHDVDRVLEVARGALPAVDLSDLRAEHFGGNVVLVNSPLSAPAPFRYDLAVPGRVTTDGGWMVEALDFDRPQRLVADPTVAQIDAASVSGGLVVRSRRPGDRIRPVGLGGRKKLQDVLVDRKVSRRERDAVPIVTDKTERIIWVAGHVLGEEFQVTERTKAVIILNLRRI